MCTPAHGDGRTAAYHALTGAAGQIRIKIENAFHSMNQLELAINNCSTSTMLG